jgi:hypothetical protein
VGQEFGREAQLDGSGSISHQVVITMLARAVDIQKLHEICASASRLVHCTGQGGARPTEQSIGAIYLWRYRGRTGCKTLGMSNAGT